MAITKRYDHANAEHYGAIKAVDEAGNTSKADALAAARWRQMHGFPDRASPDRIPPGGSSIDSLPRCMSLHKIHLNIGLKTTLALPQNLLHKVSKK